MADPGIQRALVLGDGGWGTTLAILLCKRGVSTVLWSAFPEQAAELRKDRENVRFLPGVPFPENLECSADPFVAAEGVDFVVCAVPTQFVRGVAEKFEDALKGTQPIVSASKGLEIETFKRPSQILYQVLGDRPLCVLTGPSHAEEVARGLPTTVVAASEDEALARVTQAAFTSDAFRVYTSTDRIGAELGGALKNVIALAAGISDGLELGDNAKSALLTRGMIEMARFGAEHGARPSTFFGLTGVGDLITTCCSQHSRNRRVGEEIGRGKTLEEVLAEMNMVAEGVWTTKALFGPEGETGTISMPIAEQVHAVLFEGKDAREAVLDLMRREPTGEMDGLFGDTA
ncbi:MAG: NAD(P)-dependent glycerol-3-phosphate dehydrogenase [Planctomycetota bacterium]|nr:MAG: NAD(P)-dependent glycerol-3-phosphate dehydrogenase [Planctomycetota bacterium]